jgi:hypothetical protein
VEVLVLPEAVRALREKYREIKRLRVLAAAGPRPEPRRELAALARRFPGALRELDQLPMDAIELRLAVLDAVLERGEAAPQWVSLQIGYHGTMRAALRIKRWFARLTALDAQSALTELGARYAPAPDEPPLASFDLEALRAILEPPGGRLNPWVFGQVAVAHGVEPEAVHRALFPG